MKRIMCYGITNENILNSLFVAHNLVPDATFIANCCLTSSKYFKVDTLLQKRPYHINYFDQYQVDEELFRKNVYIFLKKKTYSR